MNRVRVNSIYRYNPVFLDRFDARTTLKTGELVRVVNLPGCPRANTMGHCHVVNPQTGQFIGLVCCNSLEKLVGPYARNLAKSAKCAASASAISLYR